MGLGVYCECGKCLPITEEKAGSAVTCPCGRRVVVPLLEEFHNRPLLLSAASVERRIRRLIAEGVLPDTATCLQCSGAETRVVNLELECERSTVHASGGQRFLIIPLIWGFVWTTWREPERLEIRGRDTEVATPVSLCAACRLQLRAPEGSGYLPLAVLLLAASAVLAYFAIFAGVGLAVVGLAFLLLKRRLALRRWQSGLKELLGKVPVYRQALKRYPWAVVIVPEAESDKGRAVC
jgi:hypothetical protein